MRGFNCDPALGSPKGWLHELTQWRIADQYRKRRKCVARQAAETDETDLMEQLPNPASLEIADRVWGEEWETNLMAGAMGRDSPTM